MRFFVVFLALVALVAAENESMNMSHPYYFIHRACASESGLTPAQEEKILAFEYPDEDQVHKYILCGASKTGAVGDVKMEQVLNECVQNNMETQVREVLAYRVFQCMLQSEVGDTLKNVIRRIQTNPTPAAS